MGVSAAKMANKQENVHLQAFLYEAVRQAYYEPTQAVLRSVILQTFHDSSNAAYHWSFDFEKIAFLYDYDLAPRGGKGDHRTILGKDPEMQYVASVVEEESKGALKDHLYAVPFSPNSFSIVSSYKLINPLTKTGNYAYTTNANIKEAVNEALHQATFNQAVTVASMKFNARF